MNLLGKIMSEATYERALRALERYGFGICLAAAILWFARVDIIVPMVESHRMFLQELSESNREMSRTQADISRAIEEQARTLETQTRLLYTICPKVADKWPVEAGRVVAAEQSGEDAQN